jgi:hypothetical protein
MITGRRVARRAPPPPPAAPLAQPRPLLEGGGCGSELAGRENSRWSSLRAWPQSTHTESNTIPVQLVQ